MPDNEPKKAAALEMHYHNNCLRDAHRTCKGSQTDTESSEDLVERLCDMEILMHLQSCICNEPFRTNMSAINKKYLEIRKNNNAKEVSDKQQKHLKSLIEANLPEIEFIKLPNKRESEVLQHRKTVGEAVDLTITFDLDGLGETMSICSVVEILRKELLEYRDKWSFTGDLTSGYKKPPVTSFFLKMLLFGKNASTSKRASEIESVVESLGQLLLFNTASKRQVRYKPKTEDATFRHNAELPLTIALPLTIHQLERKS